MTGVKAATLCQLRDHLKEVPESSVYYHTHHFLRQHQFASPEPPNDFAYWVTHALQEGVLGERLAAIDILQFMTLNDLRNAFIQAIDLSFKNGCDAKDLRVSPAGMEFHFLKCTIFTIPTAEIAYDLKEFVNCLKRISPNCLYNHVFESCLRPPYGVNDFSNWLATNLDEHDLARKIGRLDPYTQTMEGLRGKIIHLAEQRMRE